MIRAQEPQAIRSMFDRIAHRYDLLNTILSGGLHKLWKKKLVELGKVGLDVSLPRILDCATGTGDLAELWSDSIAGPAEIVATDFSQEMLRMARIRHEESRIRFQWADVQSLPFQDGVFHRASISFGIRNVADARRALMELARVLKPRGNLLILEFGQPTNRWFAAIYHAYSRYVLPWVGGVISGERSAYAYLNRSSEEFPSGEKFIEIARSTGCFSKLSFFPLTGGIAWIYMLEVQSDG
jgi:demethylmenaquinone methyltransferase/2-methoxy-6-polyprenyl-1,4-benzoquinol methylase